MPTYDLVVVGSGIIGCLTAHALSVLPGSLLLIDSAGLCAGTSRSSEGNLLVSDRTTDTQVALMLRSLELWRALTDETGEDFEYEAKGSVLVTRDESEVAALESHVRWLAERGVVCDLLPDGGRAVEGCLSADVRAAAWFPHDAQVQPMLVCYRIAERLRSHGVELRLYDPITRIEPTRGAVSLLLASGSRVEAGRVILCAGVWTRELIEPLGVDLPLAPRRGHIAVLERGPSVRTKILDYSYNATLDSSEALEPSVQVAAVVESTRSGTLLCGSSRQFAGFDWSVDLGTVARILAACTALVPALSILRVIRVYVGLRPYSPDGLPMIGWVDASRTIAVATGHEGSGHGLAAVTAELVHDLVRDSPNPLLPAVDPLRFGRGASP